MAGGLIETAATASGGGGLAAALVGGLWLFLSSREKTRAATAAAASRAPADMVSAAVGFQEALQRYADSLLEDMRTEIAALRREIADLKGENETCRGENRQMAQRIDSLEAELRRRGIDLPAKGLAPGSFVAMEGDRTTVLSPSADPT